MFVAAALEATGARRRVVEPQRNTWRLHMNTTVLLDDIVGTAARDGSFKTLVAAVKAADLVETLKGKGPFTVFAPNDAAFAKLPAGTLDNLLKPENKAKLASILTYHVVPGAVMSKTLTGKTTKVKSVQGAEITIDATKDVMVDKARVVKADIETSNGVIHVIDSVIMPPAN
jgi:uncharacterized surface protein with fasciclin (FAS1) repeats